MRLEQEVKKEVEEEITRMMRLGLPIIYRRISSTILSNFPDLLICYKGIFVGVELKRDEKTKARQGQYFEMEKIQRAGGICRVIGSVKEFRIFIHDIDAYVHGVLPFEAVRLKTEEFLDD